MTKEEREDALNYFKNKLENEVYGAKYNKLAIEALEEDPIEVEATALQKAYNKGFADCRQAVLDTISELNAISFYEAQDDSKECYYEIRQAVENVPPVASQQNTGHWIPLGNYDDYGNESSYKCSECGDLDTYPDNFCPNCGARMVKQQESEE